MDREDIDMKVISLVDEIDAIYYDDDDNPLYRKVDMISACTEMAEWMQEQMINRACNFLCDTCHASYANDCKNKPCELKTGLIEAMKGE